MSTTERKPLLSDEAVVAITSKMSDRFGDGYINGAFYARDFYEAKITSGELMVVKTAKLVRADEYGMNSRCSNCIRLYVLGQTFPFCHCGAKIIEG